MNDPRSLSPLIVINDADSSTDSASDEQNEEDGADPMSCSSVDDMVMIGNDKKEGTEDDGANKWLPLDLCYGLPLFDGDLSKQVYQKVRRNVWMWPCGNGTKMENTSRIHSYFG